MHRPVGIPGDLNRKQGSGSKPPGRLIALQGSRFHARPCALQSSTEPVAVQGKMGGPGNNAARKDSLKLGPGFKPLHKTPQE